MAKRSAAPSSVNTLDVGTPRPKETSTQNIRDLQTRPALIPIDVQSRESSSLLGRRPCAVRARNMVRQIILLDQSLKAENYPKALEKKQELARAVAAVSLSV